ncbi:hypothetical protein C8R41DRAFT_848519 [Lentinula lateritia]|uniref:Uncharacterized protein n=1 Tax=Lentinula lateritia TaxID=40482 RepID=A0ABQ8V4E7_9AGAR|nr:hypothetical protein C8R41DRAFT_848519 [Lentinula lateritia]
MPKRIATPPSDINTRYFTISFPYPLNANWELKADQITFSRWIACCIKKEYLIAIMYKPTARGMVIIEVDRAFPDDEHRTLLGEHRWSEFLKRPSEEERRCCSKIFYSVYNDHRGAQKDGWKTINVLEKWFDPAQWSPNNSIIKSPYPSTHWCASPAEDRTNKKMCRPLPVAMFPPPPKPVRPVVGSSDWVQSNTAPDPKSPEYQRVIWGNNDISAAMKLNKSSTVIKPTVRLNTPSAVKIASNAWGSQGKTVATPPSTTHGPTPASVPVKPPQGAWGSRRPAVTTPVSTKAWGLPKSVAVSPSSTSSAPLSAPPAISTAVPSVPPGLIRDSASGSSSGSSLSFDWASEVEAELPIHSFSPNLNNLAGNTDTLDIANTMAKVLGFDEDEDQIAATFVDADVPPGLGFPTPAVQYDTTQETVKQNLWEDVSPVDEPKEDECPVHGVLCSKGICQVAKKKKRQQANESKNKDGRNGSSRNRGRGRGRDARDGWRRNGGERNSRSNEGDHDDNNDDDTGEASNNDRDEDGSTQVNTNSPSSSSPPGSRAVSRADSVKAESQVFDHNDLRNPFADF